MMPYESSNKLSVKHKYIFNFKQLFNYHIMNLCDEGVMYILGRKYLPCTSRI